MSTTIQNRDHYNQPAGGFLDLGITTEGLVISVAPGTFKVFGDEHQFVSQMDHAVTVDPTNETHVIGMIVQDKTTDEVTLLVDEVVLDGVDETYAFDGSSPFKALLSLYKVLVPAEATTLDGLTMTVDRILPTS